MCCDRAKRGRLQGGDRTVRRQGSSGYLLWQNRYRAAIVLDKGDSLGQAYYNLHRKSAKTIITRHHSVYRRKDLSGCFYEFIQTILVEFGRQARNGVS